MIRILKNAVLFLFILNLSSCVSLLVKKKLVLVETQEKDIEFTLKKGGTVDTPPIRLDSTKYELYNRYTYLLTQEREGYKILVTPVYPAKVNWAKWVDLGLFAIGRGLIYSASHSENISESDSYNREIGSLLSLSGGVGFIFASNRLHSATVEFPPLIKLPTPKDGEPELIIAKIDITLDSIESAFHNYKSFFAHEQNIMSSESD